MDTVVTVPAKLWKAWIAEGDLPGEPWSGLESHFWIAYLPAYMPEKDDRVYVVALGKLRGYAPLVGMEEHCRLKPSSGCLLRRGGAVAVTIPETIKGFRNFRYRFWERSTEVPFPEWRNP